MNIELNKNGINHNGFPGISPRIKYLRNSDPSASFYFKRQRLNDLFMEAAAYPVTMVCAGAGYGKTSSVYDFVEEYKVSTAWMQLSDRDNVGGRFWENFIHTIAQVNYPFVKAAEALGFPDTEDKFFQYQSLIKKHLSPIEKRILVLDDLHVLEDRQVIRFIELLIKNLSAGTSVIIISRSTPRVNISGLISQGDVFSVSEVDLCFTENELTQYLRQLEINPRIESIKEIMNDTGGWVFAINLIARYYQKAPGYGGYLRSAMRLNIFRLMETEVWNGISEKLKRFLVQLSLIEHLSFELIELLAEGDKSLIREMEKQSVYIRMDSYINAYVLHHLFLEFLSTKQDLLTEEKKLETYGIAGQWCNNNGFKIDALSYYEKAGNYEMIINILYAMPLQMPYDIARFCVDIFDRAPLEAYDTVNYLAVTHVRCSMRMGLWHKAIELAEYYEKKFLKLPENNKFRTVSLAGLYFILSYLRNFLCLNDNIFDFDLYLEKFSKCQDLAEALKTHSCRIRLLGPWANANGSAEKGKPGEYIEAVSRASLYMPKLFFGFMGGEEELVKGELLFFQGSLDEAEALLKLAAIKARDNRQYEIFHRTQIYLMRLSAAQGNFIKAEQAVKELKDQLGESEYANRYVNYDIAFTIYCFLTGSIDNIPEWLKWDFTPYRHASFVENLENQVKTRYFYRTKNFPPLLAYIEEMKHRESFLYGRISLLALEACVFYQIKEKERAFSSLIEAYNEASPNDLIMSFIELGKDMRTLISSFIREKGDHSDKIPLSWLELAGRKAASYAKRQAAAAEEYRRSNKAEGTIVLSPREMDILKDLSHGLSRAEMAVNHKLSINTVKMVVNNIYSKLGAENAADLIRIAMERKII